MDLILTEEEARVLGSLVEKAVTTPEYYPLSLNALRNACNQKSSREPVVAYDERSVALALEGLRDKHLVWFVDSPDTRVQKYRHRFAEAFDLSEPETAVMDVLMLRGPQTPGELRGRTERLHAFASTEEVESVLDALSVREAGPMVVRLPRHPGRKEHRWMHTLGGLPEIQGDEPLPPREDPAFKEVRSERQRMAALETEVAELKAGVAALRESFEAFRRQLE